MRHACELQRQMHRMLGSKIINDAREAAASQNEKAMNYKLIAGK